MSESIRMVTLEEFLAGEEASGVRHELVGGRVYAMSGGTERHDVAVNALLDRLRPGARAAGCRTFSGNRLVVTPVGNGYYPDVMVVCGPASHLLHEAEPALLVEILSPSTESHDRREKSVAYAQAPSLRLLLLVDPDRRRIEVARTVEGRIAGWESFGPGQVVRTEWGDLVVDDLYDAIDDEAST